jgi:hypothetical protein
MEEMKKTLTVNDVISFLILFAGFWIKDGLVWKAVKALVSAFGLYLEVIVYGPREVLLSKRPVPEPALAGDAWKAAYARSIFVDISKFTFRPLIQQVVDEMALDANRLITYYVMHEGRSDVA